MEPKAESPTVIAKLQEMLLLAVFEARLDGAVSTPVRWKGSLPVAGGLE